MIKLNVWLTLSTESPMLAGELIVSDPNVRGELTGQFRYSQDYLNWENCFALDPVHLPLTREVWSGIEKVDTESVRIILSTSEVSHWKTEPKKDIQKNLKKKRLIS